MTRPFFILALFSALLLPAAGVGAEAEEWSRRLGVPTAKFVSFNRILERIEKTYGPTIEKNGEKLEILRLWHVTNYAIQIGKEDGKRIIYVTGGVLRHPGLDENTFSLMTCHELGHHLGGAPVQQGRPWNSTEGQADYFATSKCMRNIFTPEEQTEYLKSHQTANPPLLQLCQKQFPETVETAHCLRSALAALRVAYVSLDMDNPSFETPDLSEVKETKMKWPAPQCRLDTLLQGALCQESKDKLFSASDAAVGACPTGTIGGRPRCWYAPDAVSR